jgi:hypothetical protein
LPTTQGEESLREREGIETVAVSGREVGGELELNKTTPKKADISLSIFFSVFCLLLGFSHIFSGQV